MTYEPHSRDGMDPVDSWMGSPPNLVGLPPKGPRPAPFGRLVYWLQLRRDVLVRAARRPGECWRWWRAGANAHEASEMGWPLCALAARRPDVQKQLAADLAEQAKQDDAWQHQEWVQLTPEQQEKELDHLRFRLVADPDRVWLTGMEQFLLRHFPAMAPGPDHHQ